MQKTLNLYTYPGLNKETYGVDYLKHFCARFRIFLESERCFSTMEAISSSHSMWALLPRLACSRITTGNLSQEVYGFFLRTLMGYMGHTAPDSCSFIIDCDFQSQVVTQPPDASLSPQGSLPPLSP